MKARSTYFCDNTGSLSSSTATRHNRDLLRQTRRCYEEMQLPSMHCRPRGRVAARQPVFVFPDPLLSFSCRVECVVCSKCNHQKSKLDVLPPGNLWTLLIGSKNEGKNFELILYMGQCLGRRVSVTCGIRCETVAPLGSIFFGGGGGGGGIGYVIKQ